jgi:GTP-binding protein Era
VIVEKDGQRGILLGKGGTALKALSTASRAEVEDFLGRPVFLELSVKVREKWRTDPKSLEALGY